MFLVLTTATPETGFNANKQMVYFNRALHVEKLANWNGVSAVIDAPCMDNCVVIVQAPDVGKVYARDLL